STSSPVAGFRISIVPPSDASRCSPAMTSFAIKLPKPPSQIRRQVLLRRCYYDAFRFQVIFRCFGPVLPPDAAEFHSAKRHLVVADMQRVDPDVSGLQSLGGEAGFAYILRPHRRSQAPHGTICFLNTFVEILDLEY